MADDEPLGEINIVLPGQKDKKVPQRKLDYAVKLRECLDEFDKCLIVSIWNVGSKQILDMRKDFRGRCRFLFGKNTLIRKVIRDYVKDTRNGNLMNLMEVCQGNVALIFTKEEVAPLRKEIEARKKQTAAKAGVPSIVDVIVPAGPTGMEPTKTAMFQAMDIPTRINRGQIDIEEPVQVLFKGKKVGASEAALLTTLGIKPFYYGMKVEKIYENGSIIDASVLDITPEEIAGSFYSGIQKVSALCFELEYPTICNVPHSLIRAYKDALALSLDFETYTWEGLETVREVLKNPGAFAGGATGGGGGAGAGADATAAAEPEKSPTPQSSSAAPNPMFGGDDSSSDDDSSS